MTLHKAKTYHYPAWRMSGTSVTDSASSSSSFTVNLSASGYEDFLLSEQNHSAQMIHQRINVSKRTKNSMLISH